VLLAAPLEVTKGVDERNKFYSKLALKKKEGPLYHKVLYGVGGI
jgi:hypothetical protein